MQRGKCTTSIGRKEAYQSEIKRALYQGGGLVQRSKAKEDAFPRKGPKKQSISLGPKESFHQFVGAVKRIIVPCRHCITRGESKVYTRGGVRDRPSKALSGAYMVGRP